MVPDARRSPGRRLQPLTEWCASCCSMVQCMCCGRGARWSRASCTRSPHGGPHTHSPRLHSERTAVLLGSRPGTVPAPCPPPHIVQGTPQERPASARSLSVQPAPLSTVTLGPVSTASPAQASREQRPPGQPATLGLGPKQPTVGGGAKWRGRRPGCRGRGQAAWAGVRL